MQFQNKKDLLPKGECLTENIVYLTTVSSSKANEKKATLDLQALQSQKLATPPFKSEHNWTLQVCLEFKG